MVWSILSVRLMREWLFYWFTVSPRIRSLSTWTEDPIPFLLRPSDHAHHLPQKNLFHKNEHRWHFVGKPVLTDNRTHKSPSWLTPLNIHPAKGRKRHRSYILVLAVEVNHSPARPMMSRPDWLKQRGCPGGGTWSDRRTFSTPPNPGILCFIDVNSSKGTHWMQLNIQR